MKKSIRRIKAEISNENVLFLDFEHGETIELKIKKFNSTSVSILKESRELFFNNEKNTKEILEILLKKNSFLKLKKEAEKRDGLFYYTLKKILEKISFNIKKTIKKKLKKRELLIDNDLYFMIKSLLKLGYKYQELDNLTREKLIEIFLVEMEVHEEDKLKKFLNENGMELK